MTDFEIIEQYLDNRMEAAARAAFEQRLEKEPELARDLALYRSMQADMEQWHQTEEERNALKQTLERVTGKQPARVIPLRWYVWRVAALLVLVLAVWQVVKLSRSGSSAENLYREYAGKINLAGSRSGGTTNPWEGVKGFLFDENYPAAITALQQVMASGTDSLYEARFYLGYCYMKINNDSAALRYFTQTPVLNNDIRERSQWYRALLYLKKGEKNSAIQLADSVANGGGVYMLQAQKLAKQLK